ncbi:MAG: hypothetical protein KU37_10045 [Sulfuricurvum sp. PC08-66]|nr:MAG: hypothetical protein KU37_10045 [Sulfuricurvum sp. PC08-66]
MRVTQSSYFNNLRKDEKNTEHELVRINKQMASGKKIEYGHENPEIFIDTMRLDNDINSLQQAETIAQRSISFTDYTDASLRDMKDVLDKFRVKLISAANDSNATSSLIAIANELRAYKDHLMNLANSKGDGKYLFGGTALEKPPVNAAGEYQGNEGVLKAFLGDKIEQPYNITGQELFLGQNDDIHRTITTNVQLLNKKFLYPDAMIEGGVAEQAKEVILTRFDTIRDMVGDDDANTKNDESTFFYVRGRRSDGFSFKERFELQSGAKVEDLLDRIGVAFGNTSRSKIVDVSIDNAGFIEINDRKTGSSKIDFHMVSSHEEVDDIDDLITMGAEIQTYNNSDFNGARNNSTVAAANSKYDHRDFKVNTVLKDYQNRYATSYSLVRDVFPEALDKIVLNGVDVDGVQIKDAEFRIDDTTTMHSFLKFTECVLGGEKGEVRARLSDGRILLADDSITPHEPSAMFVSMTTMSKDKAIKGFPSLSEMEYDRAFWEKDGAKLKSTVPQITKESNERASESTKILDVAGDITTKGTTLAIKGRNTFGKDIDYSIVFDEHPKCTTVVNNVTHQKYDIIAHGRTSGGDELTYRQLFDVISMIMSNSLPTSSNPTYIEDYLTAVNNADDMVEVSFDQAGRIVVKDKLNSVTKMEMSLFDTATSNFANSRERHPLLTFHANNALVVDDPKTNFFELVEGAIRSVELERKRANGNNLKEPRNIGIQNAIVSLEHLLEHVTNSHSKNGAQSNAIRFAQERNEAWIVNAKGIQSEIIDTDLAQASMKYNQLSTNYQSMLSTVGKVNKLGLVNYL